MYVSGEYSYTQTPQSITKAHEARDFSITVQGSERQGMIRQSLKQYYEIVPVSRAEHSLLLVQYMVLVCR